MKRIVRYIIGIIFIVSGFVKTVDTKGFSFKLEEYFAPDVFNLPFLEDYVLPIAIFVSALEIILGLMLLIRIKLKFTLYSLIALCVFFAFLTFYSAYFNVVTDCGCFGDALKLEPWQSFWKDIFLLVALLYLAKVYLKENKNSSFLMIKNGILGLGILIVAYVTYYGIAHEPIIDFRDYKIGTDIYQEKMELEKNPSEYKNFYLLKNKETQEEIELDQDEYIKNDIYWKEGTPWEIQNDKTTSKLVKQGYQSEISKFNLVNENGEDKTMEIIQLPKVYLVCSYKPRELNQEDFDLINQKIGSKTPVYGVSNELNVFPNFPNLQMDGTALKTIARSNPFVLVLEKGKIVEKKALKDIKN